MAAPVLLTQLVHQPLHFNYDFTFDQLSEKIKDQLPPEIFNQLSSFTFEELLVLRWRICWYSLARKKQLPPDVFQTMEKPIWTVRSGRGFGKTLLAANWMGLEAATTPGNYAVISPTHDDVRYTCFEGPTELYSVIPPQ